MRGARIRKVRSDISSNKLRSALAVVSLVVGTTAVGAMVHAGSTVDSSFEASFLGANPPSAVLITEPFTPDLVDQVAAHPTVDQAEGRRLHQTQITGTDGKRISVELVAMVDLTENRVARIQPTVGMWPPQPNTIVFERATAGEIAAAIGETVLIERPGQAALEVEVVGTASDPFEVAPMLGGMARAYVSIDTMASIAGSGHLNALYLRAAGQPDSRQVAAQMTAAISNDVLVPANVAIQFSAVDEPGTHRAHTGVTFLTTAMQLLSILALGIAVALVVNTIAALLAQQRQQIGVMKAIGATTRHLTVQYLTYVTILSVVALAISIPTGLLLGRAVAGFLGELANIDLIPVGVPATMILLQAAIAILLPIGAVTFAVYRASRTTVREAITDLGLTGTGRTHNGSSTLSRPTVLAYRNAVRNRVRLALTVVTVSLCGAVLVGVINTGSALTDLGDEVAGYAGHDIAISLSEPVSTQDAAAILGPHDMVVSVEGWLSKQGVHNRPDTGETSNIDLTGVPVGSTAISPTLLEGRWFEAGDDHAIVINIDIANANPDLKVGGLVLLQIEGHHRQWNIVGISTTTTVGPVAYMSVSDLAHVVGEPDHTNLVAIQLAGEAVPADTAEQLGVLAQNAGLHVGQVQTHQEARETVDGLFGIVIALLLVVGAVLAVVAVIGVAGTMTLNVVEQTREIGVLRTLGATTRSVRRLLLVQGLAIAAAGAVLGVLLSIPVSLMLGAAIRNNLISTPMPFTFSWPGVGIWIAVAMIIGALGATHPSRVASRLTIRDTLAYE